MSLFIDRFKPIDIIAIITLISGMILKFCGFDGVVGTLITMIVAFYFGEKKLEEMSVGETQKPGKEKTVEQKIIDIARERGVDPKLAVRVARCESGLNPHAVNVNKTGSRDRGLFQINDKWHPEVTDEQAFDITFSTNFFCDAVKKGKISWWNASRSCWEI